MIKPSEQKDHPLVKEKIHICTAPTENSEPALGAPEYGREL